MKEIDELKAEIEKAEKELEGKKGRLEWIKTWESLKMGDYIEVCLSEQNRIIGPLAEMAYCGGEWIVRIGDYRGVLNIYDVKPKKWQPKRGDLCIFWDIDKGFSVVAPFIEMRDGCYAIYPYGKFKYCIPFISEQQFKEHIGYEE